MKIQSRPDISYIPSISTAQIEQMFTRALLFEPTDRVGSIASAVLSTLDVLGIIGEYNYQYTDTHLYVEVEILALSQRVSLTVSF